MRVTIFLKLFKFPVLLYYLLYYSRKVFFFRNCTSSFGFVLLSHLCSVTLRLRLSSFFVVQFSRFLRSPRGQLRYSTTLFPFCQYLFSIFFVFFSIFFDPCFFIPSIPLFCRFQPVFWFCFFWLFRFITVFGIFLCFFFFILFVFLFF